MVHSVDVRELFREVETDEERRSSGALMRFVIRDEQAEADVRLAQAVRKAVWANKDNDEVAEVIFDAMNAEQKEATESRGQVARRYMMA